MKKISIISPVYNESESLPAFFKELIKYLYDNIYNFEIILVNDGSTDNTIEIIKNFTKQDNRVKYISFNKNYGQQAAIYTGLKFASGEVIVIKDCDLQDPPSLIPEMISEWEKGNRIVFALREKRDDKPSKKFSASAFYSTLNLFNKNKLNPALGEFYLIDNSIRIKLLKNLMAPLFLRGSLQLFTEKKIYIPYHRAKRKTGKSGFSFIKMLRLARDAFQFRRRKKIPLPEFDIAESNIFDDKSVAIIGAGFSGLVMGYYLGRLGMKVSIYERDNSIGGLLASETILGVKYDRYYHHIFKSDTNLIGLIGSLGLAPKLSWNRSHVGALYDNKLYAMNGLLDLWRLPVMSKKAKIKMLAGGLGLSRSIKNVRTLTAKSLISQMMGKAAWSYFWQALFEAKFGAFTDNISAAWFQSRIKTRALSRQLGHEVLGYPEGSFDTIVQALKKEILANGGKVFTNSYINFVTCHESRFSLSSRATNTFCEKSRDPSINKTFNYCISTLPPSETSKIFPSYKSPHIKYIGFVGAIVVLKKRFSQHYWINVLDKDAPFGVIVEQNNLATLSLRAKPMFFGWQSNLSPFLSSRAQRSGAEGSLYNHILYLGKYIKTTSGFYNLPDKEIIGIAADWLERIKPGIKGEIIEIKIFKDSHAQPIITTKYKKTPHTIKSAPGFCATSMAHIFPEDRGIENAVTEANKICRMIINNK